MKTIKKIYLLSVLALTVTAQVVRADDATDTKIHNAVETRLATTPTTAVGLANTLGELKTDILAIIATAPDAANYATLKAAVEKLDPKQMLAMVIHLKNVLEIMPNNTKALILTKVPLRIRLAMKLS
ncbi:MAG: hypothetical protein WC747_00680 [Candidatus Babeliales bacterium]